jgi:alpha-tubulin suppressor-like RCC1 family protein
MNICTRISENFKNKRIYLAFAFAIIVSFFGTISSSTAAEPYCTPVSGSSYTCYYLWITNVTFNTINNSSACSEYSDYSQNVSTSVNAGSSYNIGITCNNYPMQYNVWIDFNQNGEFEESELVVDGLNGDPGVAAVQSISLPANAAPGNTVMRIMSDYQYQGVSYDPCYINYYGEVEDYGIEIIGMPTLTTTAISNVTTTSAKSGGNITSDAGFSITSRGVCWSTSTNPTIANSKTTDSSGIGSFTSTITGLSTGTKYYVRAYAVCSAGTAYGNELSFTTNSIPTVTTANIINIYGNSASSGGNVTADGGVSVTARGVCWSTSQNPTTSNSKTTDGTGTSSYTSSITGLTDGIIYYVRAYAVNALGTAYGDEKSFLAQDPSVAGCAISCSTPEILESFNFNYNGLSYLTTYNVSGALGYIDSPLNAIVKSGKTYNFTGMTGLWYSSYYYHIVRIFVDWNQNGTFSDANELVWTSGTNYVKSFSGSITVPSWVTPLKTYRMRITTGEYSSTALETGCGTLSTYSQAVDFKLFLNNASTAPFLLTTAVSNITTNSASSGGNITDDGGFAVTARGVCWSTSQNPTTANSKTTDGSSTGSFTSYITGLTPLTTYYVRAYATNSIGTNYGSQVSFTTVAYIPTISTTAVSNIAITTASSGGNVTNDCGAAVTARGVCWSTSQNPTIANYITKDSTGLGNFTSGITGLSPNTTYYVRAYATNVIGTAYGDEKSFKTNEDTPKLLYTWGHNYYGQLGDGTMDEKTSPAKVGTATNWVQISTGYMHTIAIKSDGTLWAWGANWFGQLGDGTTTDRLSPVQIGTATNWSKVSVSYGHTIAIKTDGTLWAWGYNEYGQLGDSTTTDKLSPLKIGTATNWSNISTGDYHTLAIKSDGTIWSCGHNSYGQLGDGTMNPKLTFAQIGTATNWSNISAGSYHSAATKIDGTLWAWGENWDGAIGDGSTTNRLSPIQIGSETNWSKVSCGYMHTAATKSNGSLWAWGSNYSGQLGDGTTNSKYSPVQIGTGTNWSKIGTGESHTSAIMNDGTLWAWGNNSVGQLGDGTYNNVSSPIQIGKSKLWTSIAAGSYYTAALKNQAQIGITINSNHYYNNMICVNEEVLFTPTFSEPGNYTYTWYVNNVNCGTGNTLKYVFAAAGQYAVKLSIVGDDDEIGTNTSTITITDQCPVTVLVNDIGACKNSTPTITPSIIFGGKGTYSYSWSPASDFVNSTVRNATVKSVAFSKEFTLTATDVVTNATGAGYSYMTVSESPSVSFDKLYLFIKNSDPVDLTNEDVLKVNVSGGTSPYQYKWMNNNGVVVDATSIYPPLGSSKYVLIVTDATGCTSIEKRLTIFRSNGKDIYEDIIPGMTGVGYMFTYPNPVTDNVSIFADFNTEMPASLKIYNLLGKEVFTMSIDNTKLFDQQINISALITGVYTLVIQTPENTFAKQFVKQ